MGLPPFVARVRIWNFQREAFGNDGGWVPLKLAGQIVVRHGTDEFDFGFGPYAVARIRDGDSLFEALVLHGEQGASEEPSDGSVRRRT